MKNKKSLVSLAVVVLMLSFITLACAADKGKAKAQTLPVFPDFVVQTLDGKDVSLYDLYKDKGKVVVLDLFATWCPPCKMEIPWFVELQEQYKDKLVFVGISFDQNGPSVVVPFAKTMKINYDLLMGTSELARAVNLSGIPRTFVLTSDFRIVKDVIGVHMKNEFEEFILKAQANAPVVAKPNKKKK